MRTLHDFIHKLPDTQTDFSNGGMEHIVEDTGFNPFPESFHDVQLRTVRRQKTPIQAEPSVRLEKAVFALHL